MYASAKWGFATRKRSPPTKQNGQYICHFSCWCVRWRQDLLGTSNFTCGTSPVCVTAQRVPANKCSYHRESLYILHLCTVVISAMHWEAQVQHRAVPEGRRRDSHSRLVDRAIIFMSKHQNNPKTSIKSTAHHNQCSMVCFKLHVT
jgi:hypothetical protein